MHDSTEVLDRTSECDPLFVHGPQTPAQAAWLDQTCALVEAFTADVELDFDARPLAGLAVHFAADFLFLHYAHEAAWSRLEPAALAIRLDREMSGPSFELLRILSAFFRFLAATERMPRGRGQYLACYFESLATIQAAAYPRQSRAARRARADTEARERRANRR